MRRLIAYTILILTIGFSSTSQAQQTLFETMTHDDLDREYILYVPEMYTGETAVPLVFNFHGVTQFNDSFMNLADFRPLADSANFIVCYPQGTVHNGFTHWNVGTSEVDDIGFIDAMIDEIIAGFNVDATRIYSTGYSNGAYLSYMLASELSPRFAAIAPVKGKMSAELISECNCEHQMPVLAINNTNDFMVSYYDAPSVDEVVSYWAGFNSCDETADTTQISDIDPDDNIDVERIIFTDGDYGVNVELIKIIDNSIGWGHDYPVSNSQDPWYFDSPTEIWEFFSRYDINGLIGATEVENSNDLIINKFELADNFPNPFNPSTTIKYSLIETKHVSLSIYSIDGSLVDVLVNGVQQAGNHKMTFDGSNLASGVYFYQLKTAESSVSKKMILIK